MPLSFRRSESMGMARKRRSATHEYVHGVGDARDAQTIADSVGTGIFFPSSPSRQLGRRLGSTPCEVGSKQYSISVA
ncbi:hypothetical protein K504DRAFT_108846 [Pleomassaria siparia CBS 279.74]|uniref:Uncharacterized protein n=1 Tax=Pleomassaria siparia CBS 279.74 TaxID=1314801 RepID=A0A6G1JVT8_9PLEO|nr:hypothetical protein K504DRAFT_108846 [Pleomassaria siparia CBS 279.74]